MPRYAAVDIGSNSVRFLVADVNGGSTRILAEDRQVTRLGESVFREGRISPQALDLLCDVLRRMAVSYRRFDVVATRAVATSAVRDTGNQKEFLERTSSALGSNVEIISGSEEARLIHLGVEARWPRAKERALLIDVGGGSAELIVTQDGQLIDAVSKPLGAVRLTELFLKNDPPGREDLDRLGSYIDEKLQPFIQRHGGDRFDRVIATSATAAAIICASNEIPRAKRESADRVRARNTQVVELFARLIKLDVDGRRKIIGIGPRRAEIVVAGTAVFLQILQALRQQSIHYCSAGVRDGIIADLTARGVGRELSLLSNEQRAVVESLAQRYGVAMRHARQVALLSHELFEALQSLHRLPATAGELLEAAAYLHDIGHFVSNMGHHKHSYYLVANSDMPGFTDKEREVVANLCRFHRKSMPQPRHSQFQLLSADEKKTVIALAPLLRIADALDRSHEQTVSGVVCAFKNGGVAVVLDTRANTELELWAATDALATFQQVYGISVSIERAPMPRATFA